MKLTPWSRTAVANYGDILALCNTIGEAVNRLQNLKRRLQKELSSIVPEESQQNKAVVDHPPSILCLGKLPSLSDDFELRAPFDLRDLPFRRRRREKFRQSHNSAKTHDICPIRTGETSKSAH